MSARLVPLGPEHLAFLAPRPGDEWIARQFDNPALVKAVTAPGASFAMIDGGYVLGAGGVLPQWQGRALAWLLAGRFARPRHLALAARVAIPWLERLQADPRFARIEASTRCDRIAHCRFLEHLGFGLEGIMRRYGPDGSDHALYARVTPC